MDIHTCLRKRFLIKGERDHELSSKEIAESEYDFSKAEKAFQDEDYKWAIVKCYYSMFHAAKAILYQLGYIEKKHIAIVVVLEELDKQGRIDSRFVNDFKAAMTAREDADYNYSYSREIAELEISNCSDFFRMARQLTNQIRDTAEELNNQIESV